MMLSDAERFAVLVCQEPNGELVGFTEESLRSRAEGWECSPVGYLGGWHVAWHARRQGIAASVTAFRKPLT